MVSGRKRRCPGGGKNSMTSEARRAETCLEPLGKDLYSVRCLLLSQNTRVCIGHKERRLIKLSIHCSAEGPAVGRRFRGRSLCDREKPHRKTSGRTGFVL